MRPLSFMLAPVLAVPSLAAGKKDEKQAQKADFAKLVARVAEARKAAAEPKASPFPCKSLAKDWISYAKDYKAPEGWFNAGVLFEECGDKAEAEKYYRDAI